MKNKLIPKHQTPWGVMQSDNTRVNPIIVQPRTFKF